GRRHRGPRPSEPPECHSCYFVPYLAIRFVLSVARAHMSLRALLHHGGTPMDALLTRRVAACSRMHGAAVVPYDDVASSPFVPVLGVGWQHVPVQLGEQRITFRF